MNKAELIAKYQECLATLNLSPEMAVVSAGGACLMYDLRASTADIDLEIPHFVFNKLSAALGTEVEVEIELDTLVRRVRVIPDFLGCIDLHLMEHGITTEMVDGVCVYSLSSLLEQKLVLNRMRDQADIKMIREAIKMLNMSTALTQTTTTLARHLEKVPEGVWSMICGKDKVIIDHCVGNGVSISDYIDNHSPYEARLRQLKQKQLHAMAECDAAATLRDNVDSRANRWSYFTAEGNLQDIESELTRWEAMTAVDILKYNGSNIAV